MLLLDEPRKSVTLANIAERPVLSLNRGFSAPITLDAGLSDTDLAFLAAHDSDPFNRWQAIQTIALGLLTGNVAALRAGKPPKSSDALVAALNSTLKDRSLEPAFVALALTLPSEADMAREIGQDIDPDAIYAARTALRAEIGSKLGTELREIYSNLAVPGPYSPKAEHAGRRALRNVALDLLCAGADAAEIARAKAQYDTADNMTDRFAALATLTLHRHAGAHRRAR